MIQPHTNSQYLNWFTMHRLLKISCCTWRYCRRLKVLDLKRLCERTLIGARCSGLLQRANIMSRLEKVRYIFGKYWTWIEPIISSFGFEHQHRIVQGEISTKKSRMILDKNKVVIHMYVYIYIYTYITNIYLHLYMHIYIYDYILEFKHI